MKPKFSIITTVLNGAEFIEKCMLSIKNEFAEYEYEHIIIDAGSDDETVKLVSAYPNTCVKVIKGISIAEAWNQAVQMVSGEWIIIVNADDFLSVNFSDALEEVTKGKAKVYFGDVKLVDSRYRNLRLFRGKTPNTKNIVMGIPFLHPGVIAHKSVYEKIGKFEVKYIVGFDADWLLRCYHAGILFSKHSGTAIMLDGGLSKKRELQGFGEYIQSLYNLGYLKHVYVAIVIKLLVLLRRGIKA